MRIEAGAPTGIYVNERTPGNAHRFDYHRRGSAGSLLAPEDIAPAFISGLAVLHTSGISLAVVCGCTVLFMVGAILAYDPSRGFLARRGGPGETA